MFVLANLAAGVTSILPNSDMRRPAAIRARPIARQIWDSCPTRLAASPAFLERLLARERHEPGLLQHFDRIYLGGAPVFPRLMRAASAAAPMASVVAVYGSTEAEPIAQIRWADATYADRQAMREGAGLLAGHPVSAIELRILPDRWGKPLPPSTNDAFERDALPPGRTGEIVVSGDHVLTGYLDGSGDEETKLRVGAGGDRRHHGRARRRVRGGQDRRGADAPDRHVPRLSRAGAGDGDLGGARARAWPTR